MTYKLPEGWKEVKLGDVIDKQIDNRGRNPSEYLNYSEYPVIDNYLIKNERYPDLEKVKRYISKDTFENFLRGYVEKDDVIITLVGNGIGNVSMIPNNKCTIIQNTLGLRCNNLMDNSFLFYTLLYNQSEIVNFDRGSSQPSIRKTDLFRQRIKFPPLKEQKVIANTLLSLDDKIENNNKIAKNLEEQAQAIFKHWFVDFEFPNEKGKPYKSSGGEMVESELGMIPKGWEVKNIKEVVRTNRRGISPNYTDKSGIPVINQRCIRDFSIKKEEIKYHDNNKKKANSECYLKSYDILINSMGTGTLGRVAQTGKDVEKILVHSCITILRSNGNLIDQSILGYWAKYNQTLFENMGSGSTGQTSLRKTDINEIKLVVPDINIQNKTSILLKRILDYKDILYYQNHKLEELRDTLLPKLISGELRIPLD